MFCDIKISVVVPTLNRSKSIHVLLDSLIRQTYSNFEVVIVDGGSSDNTKEIVESYRDRLNILWGEQFGGLVKQENKAIDLVSGEIYMRTDDDAEFNENTLEVIAGCFKDEKVAGACVPTITPDKSSRDLFLFQDLFENGSLFWRSVGYFYFNYILEGRYAEIGKITKSGSPTLGSNLDHVFSISQPVEVDQLECTSFAVRLDALKEVGGFDDIYGRLSEYNESAVCCKLREKGYKLLLNPNSKVLHHTSKSGAFSARSNSYDRIINFIVFYMRHIRPDTLSKFLHFWAFIIFQNSYYTYMFIRQRKTGLLGSFPGTVAGFIKHFKSPYRISRNPIV